MYFLAIRFNVHLLSRGVTITASTPAQSVVPHFRSGGGVSLHCQSRATLLLINIVGIANQSDGNALSSQKKNVMMLK